MADTTIEKEVVQMVFDGKGFGKGVQQSVDQVGELKKALNFTGSEKGLENIEKASKVDFSRMASSLESISSKLSITGVAAAAFVYRVTNAVIDGAKQLANVLLFTPLKTGLEEYETQMNAIQTILSNTKKQGTTLGEVNSALDELNQYADLTIYNFTQMTSAIGKFTAAGVGLDDSVASIKGLSNLAAASGTSAEDASRAYYQMSQAIATGTVRLQDWISVENAGLGGALFQDALTETARVHGVAIDQILDTAGSFRNSLQEQWLTSDIMLETLQKFTGDLTEAQLESMGYTEDQIAGIIELGKDANDAATKIKTLTQLKDVMAEALQSGWSQTWRIVFGDFEEARGLFTGIGDHFSEIIAKSSDGRNAMLEFWAQTGGRSAAVHAFYNVVEGLENILRAVGEAVREVFKPLQGKDLTIATFRVRELAQKFKMASENLDGFKTVVQAGATIIKILISAVSALLRPFGILVGNVLPEASSSFGEFVVKMAEGIIAFSEWADKTDFFNAVVEAVIAKFREWFGQLGDIVDRLGEFGIIQDIIGWIQGLTKNDFTAFLLSLVDVLKLSATPIRLLALGIQELYLWFSKLDVVKNFVDQIKSVTWDQIKEAFIGIGEGVKEFIDSIRNDELVGKLIEYLNTFDGRRLQEFLSEARNAFGWISDIVGKITGQMGRLKSKTDSAGGSFDGLGKKIRESLGNFLDYLIEGAQNIDYSSLFDVVSKAITGGLFAGLVLALRSLASGDFITDGLKGFFGTDVGKIGKGITGSLGQIQGTLKAFQSSLKADALQKIAIAIAILAGSLVLLTLVDSTKLLAASAAISVMVATLFGGAGALGKIDTAGAAKASVAIVGISAGLLIASIALKQLSDLDPNNIELTMAAMAAALVALVVAVNSLSTNSSNILKSAAIMIVLAGTLYLMSDVISTFAKAKPETVAQGLAGVAATLALLTGTLLLMQKSGTTKIAKVTGALYGLASAIIIIAKAVEIFGNMDLGVITQGLQTVGIILGGFALFTRAINPAGVFSAALGMIVMTAALLVMGVAIKQFGNLSWDELIRGLVGLGAALAIIVVAANLMSGALLGAAAMLVMAVAITGLAVALSLLGALSWAELGVALAGLAATFVVLGVAGLLIAPIVPVLIGLGAAMLLMGLAATTLGVGLVLASIGLLAIAGSAAAIGAGIAIVAKSASESLPALATAFADALVNVLQVFADRQPEILEAMNTIILGLISGVITLIPDIVAVMGDMILALLEEITSRLPEMIEKGYEILLAFLQGIADNIADIVATGFRIVTEIINGIAEGIPDLIESAFNLILTFLDAVADAVEEYTPQIIEAGTRIGVAIVKGMVEGLWDSVDVLLEAISDLVQEAIDRFKARWGIDSPSKVTYDMAKYIMLGFAGGILDKINIVTNAFDEFSGKAQNGIRDALDSVSRKMDDKFAFEPVISPVLDLTNFNAGANRINDALSGQSFRASLAVASAEGSFDYADSTNGKVTREDFSGVTFNQYNYSPKALDRPAIFRQTQTLTARLANREF